MTPVSLWVNLIVATKTYANVCSFAAATFLLLKFEDVLNNNDNAIMYSFGKYNNQVLENMSVAGVQVAVAVQTV